MEWIWIKNSCKSHLFQTARNFPTVKATHILKKIASWIIFHCEIYIYIYLNFQVFILFNSILFNSIFKKNNNSIFNFRETLCSFSFRDNQMQNIWNKAYFYQLHQPKAPSPQIINVGWSVLGKNNIAVWERGEVAFFQYILHLIVLFTN